MSVLVKGSGGKKSHGVNFITDMIDLSEETTGLKRVLTITPHANTTTSPGASCAYPDGTICRVTNSNATVLDANGNTLLNLTGLTITFNNASIFRTKHPSKQIYYFVGTEGDLYAFSVPGQSYATIKGVSFVYFDKWERLIAVRHNSTEATALILDDTTLSTLNTVPIYADKNFTGTLTSATKIYHRTGGGYTNNRPCFDNKNWTVLPISNITDGGTASENHYRSYYIDNRVDVLTKGVILHYYENANTELFAYISKNDEYLITCDMTAHQLKVWDFSGLKKGDLITTVPYYSNGTNYYHFSPHFICKDGREMTIGIGDGSHPVILSFKDGAFNLIAFTTSIGVMLYGVSRFSLREKTGSLFVDYGSNVIQCGIELEDYND